MPIFKKNLFRQKLRKFLIFEFFTKFAKHKNAYIFKTLLDRADYTHFGCHNSTRLEAEHFLNTSALTFISFSGRFVFAVPWFKCLQNVVKTSAITHHCKLVSNIAHVGRPSIDICRLHKLTSI